MARKSRPTPGKFRTRVITDGVTPSLHVDYKSTRIKQYHKDGRALRTETTINNSCDFAIGKRLTNLPALRQIGFTANRRLLDVQRLSHDPIGGTEASRPPATQSVTTTAPAPPACASPTPASRPCCASAHLPAAARGFTNPDLRDQLAAYLGRPPGTINPGQRLRPAPPHVHGVVQRCPQTHRYRVTGAGLPPCPVPHPRPRPPPHNRAGRTHRTSHQQPHPARLPRIPGSHRRPTARAGLHLAA